MVRRMASRGVRNNNPGNLEYNPAWQGLKPTRTDDRFCEFVSMAFGFRALAVTLCTYQDKHGISTVRGAITRWAPPSENPTLGYIADVCSKAKVGADDTINFHDFNEAAAIINAIAEHENGVKFNRADLVQGCIKAGLENCPRGALGSAGKVAAPVITAASGYAAEHVDWLAEKFQWLQGSVASAPHFVRGGFWTVAAIVALAVVYGEIRKMRAAK